MTVGELVAKLTLDKSGYEAGLSTAQKQASAFGQTLKQVGGDLTKFVTLPLLAIGGAMLKSTADMEKYQASFKTLLGSSSAARQMLDELKKFAASTPFNFPELAESVQTMLSFGISAEDATVNLQMLGDIAQGSKEKLGSLTLAFSQIMSTGRLMGQDLLQLINAGFNPLSIISQKTGRSMSELKDAMAEGAISAEMVRDAFVTATSAGGLFFGGMETASKTLSGQWSTLVDNVGELGRSFGEMLLPIAKAVIGVLSDVIKWIQNLDDGAKRFILTFAAVAAAAGPVIVVLGTLFTMMAANPIGAVIVAVVALTAATVALATAESDLEKQQREFHEKQMSYIDARTARHNKEAKEYVSNEIKMFEAKKKTQRQILDEAKMQNDIINDYTKNFEKNTYERMDADAKKAASDKAYQELQDYFAQKDNKRRSDWIAESKKAQEEFAELRMTDHEREMKALDEKYARFKKYGVDRVALDRWYSEQKRDIDERLKEEEENYFRDAMVGYQKLADAKAEALKEDAEETDEALEKEKAAWEQFFTAVKDMAFTAFDFLKGAAAEYFEMQRSELEAQVDREAEVAEEFAEANASEFEKELDDIEYKKSKFIAAGVARAKAEAWAAKEIDKIKDKATKDELANINTLIKASEDEQEKKYQAERDLAMKKYKIEVDAFNANKLFSLASIAINIAEAIMKGFATLGPIGGAIAAVVIGGLGIAQIAAVIGQQPPPPPAYQYGGWVGGSDGVDTNVIRASRGEFVVNPEAAAANADELEAINSGRTGGSSGAQPVTIVVQTSEGRIIGQADLDFFYDASKNGDVRVHPRAIRTNA